MTQQIGPYEIIEKLGAGGMGTVYRARHVETGQIVALKVMRHDIADDASYLRRFRREADIAGSVHSPNIVSIFDAGQHEELPYIAMELVEGETLGALIRKSGPFPFEQALDIAIQVAQGLYAAYQKDVIHRDISPQNILVTPDGTAKIADFGIARSQSSGTLTGTGMFIGKPSYAAPEMFDGQADTRSDMYSLGIVLFEMLSGRPPFVAPTPLATMDMQMRQQPPRLGDLGVRVSPAIEQILKTCLQKTPAERFQSPRELLSALTATLQGAEDVTQFIPVAAGHGGGRGQEPPAPSASGDRRNAMPVVLAVSGVAIVAMLGIGAVVLAGASGGDDTPPSVTNTVTPSNPSTTSPTTQTLTEPPTPTPIPSPLAPTILSPAAGQLIDQPTFGACPGGDVTWTFSWQPSGGTVVSSYEIRILQPDGNVFRNEQVMATSYSLTRACNEVVPDEQLTNWTWQVRASSPPGDWGNPSAFNIQSRNPCKVFGLCTVRVDVSELRFRPDPSTHGSPIENSITPGTMFRITGGPVFGEQYVWWPLEIINPPSNWGNKSRPGWIAEGKEDRTTTWLTLVR